LEAQEAYGQTIRDFTSHYSENAFKRIHKERIAEIGKKKKKKGEVLRNSFTAFWPWVLMLSPAHLVDLTEPFVPRGRMMVDRGCVTL
jgi:hypothetical protein